MLKCPIEGIGQVSEEESEVVMMKCMRRRCGTKKVLSGETEDQRELFNVVAVREQ